MLPYHTGFDEQGRPTFSVTVSGCSKRPRTSDGRVRCTRVHRAAREYPVRRRGGDTPQAAVRVLRPQPENLRKPARQGEKLDARGSYYYARELLAHKRYAQAVEAFEAFAMPDGWTENKIDACLGLSQALTALGEHEQAKRALTLFCTGGAARSAVCCALAALEYADNRARQAVFWYETAIRAASTAPHGFIDVNACAYAPALGLCACWDKLGDPASLCLE